MPPNTSQPNTASAPPANAPQGAVSPEYTSTGSVVAKAPATPFTPPRTAQTGPVAGPSAQSVMNMVMPGIAQGVSMTNPEASANQTALRNAQTAQNIALQQAVSGELQQVTGGAQVRTIDKVKAEAEREPEMTPLRTYQSDVEMYLKSQNGSLTKIAVAEENKRANIPQPTARGVRPAQPNADFTPAPNVDHTAVPQPPKTASSAVSVPPPLPQAAPAAPKPRPISVVEIGMPPVRPSKGRLLVISSLVLLFVGGGVFAAFLFSRAPEAPEAPSFVFSPTITTDLQKEFNITNVGASSIVSALENEREKTQIALGSVLSIYFTEKAGESKVLVSPGKFLQAIGSSAPTELTRALTGNLTFGLHSSNGNQPFLILKVTDYQNGFAGMLLWEKDLEKDLSFFIKPKIVLDTAATTSIRTIGEHSFGDIVIKNRDVRILVNESGATLLLYAFPDPTTIIITTNERTLDEISKRLIQSRIVR